MTRTCRTIALVAMTLAVVASSCGDDAAAPPPTTILSTTTTIAASPTTTTTLAGSPTTTAAPGADGSGGQPDPLLVTNGVMAANGGGTPAEFESYLEAVAGTEDDGPFYMVNLLDFADIAHYPEDSEFFGSTGAEANQRYNAVSAAEIEAVGGERVFVGTVSQILLGDGQDWDLVAIVRYPSRAAILELRDSPDFAASVEHKWASLDNTFALVTESLDLGPAALLPPVDHDTVPFPPTADDPPFVMFHLINFHEEAQYASGEEPDDAPISGAEAVARYSENAGIVAAPLGVRPAGWFEVIVPAATDGRTWDEARLNPFPSTATFEALTTDETWEAGTFHRAAGIEDTYAIKLAPLIWEPDLVD